MTSFFVDKNISRKKVILYISFPVGFADFRSVIHLEELTTLLSVQMIHRYRTVRNNCKLMHE
jgi:hypothetical protein